MMDAQEARERYVEMLMDFVRRDRFPSIDHMKRAEAALTPETAGDYLEMLMEKVSRENYPSPSMLKRIENVAAQLPQRRISRRELAQALQDDDDEQ
jgi:hypothetical protein